MVAFARMTDSEVDLENERAVQPGVVNLISQCLGARLLLCPDPSSQRACTIGGSGGTGGHPLAYGVTTNHVLAS